MEMDVHGQAERLEDLSRILLAMIGVVDVKLLVNGDEAWIGVRTSIDRPANVLLQQLDRAKVARAFGLRAIHFGILAD